MMASEKKTIVILAQFSVIAHFYSLAEKPV